MSQRPLSLRPAVCAALFAFATAAAAQTASMPAAAPASAATGAPSALPAQLQDFDAYVNFALDDDGHVREMRIQPISPLTDFSFDFQDLRPVPVKVAAKQE